MPDLFHYKSLTLQNVRAFATTQTLELSTKDGAPARWCVILGENGAGKTTLMQSLAVMRPKPAFARNPDGQVAMESGQKEGKETDLPPDSIEPELTALENDQIESFVRHGNDVTGFLRATLRSSEGQDVELGIRISVKDGELDSVDPEPAPHKLSNRGPLIISYHASRHAGDQNVADVTKQDPAAALLDEQIELMDVNDVIETLDYATLAATRDKTSDELATYLGKFRDALLEAISAIIPTSGIARITPKGPRLPGSAAEKSGLWVKTPSGDIPLHETSLGYRVTISWVADLAWRLYTQRPDSPSPMHEHAIVLIDEVDLHLHPKWQRALRGHLLEHFPNVQFIVTSHSPFVAQESIARNDPVAVVRWENDHAVIVNGPLAPRAWRFEEVVVEAFDIEAPVDTSATRKLRRRRALLLQSERSPEEQAELEELNVFVHDLQERGSEDEGYERLLKRVKQLEEQLAGAR